MSAPKKYVVKKFLEFIMQEGIFVINQARDFQKIIHELESEDMSLPEQFVVASAIHKLLSSWKDFYTSLKHKKKEMTMEDLIVRLKIQEQHKDRDSKGVEYLSESHLTESR